MSATALPPPPSSTTLLPGTSDTALDSHLIQLLQNRHVLGLLLLSSPEFSIIRAQGAPFEGEAGRRYARVVGRIVRTVREGVQELEGGDAGAGPGGEATTAGGKDTEVRFLRVRTKRHELMITPDERYILVVLQDPTS